jgi:membrane-associated phospholipid phosphatase
MPDDSLFFAGIHSSSPSTRAGLIFGFLPSATMRAIPKSFLYRSSFISRTNRVTSKLFGSPMLLAVTFCFSLSAQTSKPDRLPSIGNPDTESLFPDQQSRRDYDRSVSWKLIIPNILSDQKAIWLFPVKVTQDHNWIPALSVVGATAGLFMLDPYEGRYFHETSTFRGFNRIFTSNATGLGSIIAPVSFYAAGLVRKDTKMQRTALLAGEAVADAEILATVLKDIDRRVRPVTFTRQGNYWDSWFENKGFVLRGNGSFPSGHAIAAFSIATVVAHEYRTHRWVPYVAYGMAGLVGFSRLSLSAHFTSDVFVGAALGYSISRFAVLRY